MPHFYKGYDKHLDITEEEWLEQQLDNADEPFEPEGCLGHESTSGPIGNTVFCDGSCEVVEGEPHEDTYLPGIPDYDIFNRPSWGEEE